MTYVRMDCPVCNHSSGDHTADHVKEHHCCATDCDCPFSYSDIIEGKTGPSQLDRVEEKLDAILAWITKKQLEEMVKDLE